MIKKIIGGIGALVLVFMIVNMISSPDLELTSSPGFLNYNRRLTIKNTGTSPVKILDIEINNDASCTTPTKTGQNSVWESTEHLSDHDRHIGWVFGSTMGSHNKLIFRTTPRELSVGASSEWFSTCSNTDVVRVKVKTDQGSGSYTF